MEFFCGVVMFLSCSSDNDSISSENEPHLSKWINKSYTFYDSQWGIVETAILVDSIEFTLANNKIISFSGENNINVNPKTISGKFSYSNNKIKQREIFINNELTTISIYNYNEIGELIEYLNQNKGSNSNEYYKSEYTHTTDTIFSKHYESSNGIDYILNKIGKTVLDEDDNRIYNKSTSISSNSTYINTRTFDLNNNLLTNNIDGSTIYKLYLFFNN